jgi:hypothetical protein
MNLARDLSCEEAIQLGLLNIGGSTQVPIWSPFVYAHCGKEPLPSNVINHLFFHPF